MTEIFVALMGLTGVGKSSFIKLCSTDPQEVKIGHTLDPCTAGVNVHQCQYDQHTTINLIDTPGFDEGPDTDAETLRKITPWLTKTYRKKIQLSGIIYLHRITDVRMQKGTIKNILLFKALCGTDALKNVVLATSMWDKIDESEGQQREDQLRNTGDWWGSMCKMGSTVLRHDNTRESAMRIIGRFVSKPTTVLQIQRDLVDLGKSFDATDAGVELNREMAKVEAEAKQKMDELEKEWKQAFEQKDRETMDLFDELRAEARADRDRRDESYRQLQISMDLIQQEQRRNRELERQYQTSKANDRMEIRQLRNQLEQQSLAERPSTKRPKRRDREQHIDNPQATQEPVPARRAHPRPTKEAIPVSKPKPAPAPAPAPAQAPDPVSAPSIQRKPEIQWNKLDDYDTILCTIKYKTKLKHWMGSSADKEIIFMMDSGNDNSLGGSREYPRPKTREEFLNLVKRNFFWMKNPLVLWFVKEDVPWTPCGWFPESEYVGKDSSFLSSIFSTDRNWVTLINQE